MAENILVGKNSGEAELGNLGERLSKSVFQSDPLEESDYPM